MAQVTTHVTDARARLIHQFRSIPNFLALLDALVDQIQDAEDAFFDLFDLLDIDLMTADNLDTLGEILGESRDGKTDADYRLAIRNKILTRRGSGTPDQVIDGFDFITDSTVIDYDEEAPAGFVIYGDGTYPTNILALIEAIAPAGVYVGILDFLEWEDSDGALWEDSDTIYIRWRSSGR